jgi:hypothetical protein
MRRYGGATRADLADSDNWLSRRSADRYVHATAEGLWIAPLNSDAGQNTGRQQTNTPQQISTPKSLMLRAAKCTSPRAGRTLLSVTVSPHLQAKIIVRKQKLFKRPFASSLAKCRWARNILRHVSCFRHAPHKRCVNN